MRHTEDNDDFNQEGLLPLSEFSACSSFRVSGKDYNKRDVLLTMFKTDEVKEVGYGDYTYLYRYRTANVGGKAHFTSDEYDDYWVCLQAAMLSIYRAFYKNEFYEDKQEHNPSSQE